MEDKSDFETLLADYVHCFKRGDLVTGTVMGTDSSGFLIDIGDKSVAFLPQREVDGEIKKGESHQFLITDYDDREEKFVLSLRRVHQAFAWQELEKLKASDEVILGEISSCVKGGLIVEILGIKGFVHSSQLLLRGKEFEVGEKLELKILTLDQEKENFILSNKKVHSDIDLTNRKNVFAQIEVGQVLKGCVVRLAEFGAFVDIGGVDGLLPLSQMSWKWVEHPSDLLKLGDSIEVEVIAVDRQKSRVSLSLKTLEEDPWKTVDDKLREGDVVDGTVTRLKPFGAFVEVLAGIEALLSQKEAEAFAEQKGSPLAVGEKIKAKILKVNSEERKISLGLA